MQMALDALVKDAEEYPHATLKDSAKLIKALRDRLDQWEALDRMVAENERLGLYDNPDLATVGEVGVWGEITPCKDHPDAPHGFDRNASHSEDRYVCECEYWESPPEPKPLAWLDTTDWIVTREPPWADYEEPDPKQLEYMVPLYRIPPKREWVGLTDEEIDYLEDVIDPAMYRVFARRIEAKLKEKNTCCNHDCNEGKDCILKKESSK
jgi:hypothetical protein